MNVVASEARAKKRFVLTKPMVAMFGGVGVTLLDLSQTGAQVAHSEPFDRYAEDFLVVDVPGHARQLQLRSRVVWTRRDGAGLTSGLVILEERADLAADFLEYLLHLKKVRSEKMQPAQVAPPPTPAVEAKKSTLEALTEIDETKPVIQAKEYLDRFPGAAAKWRALASRCSTPAERATHPIEVLAVWELLNRSVRLEVVEFVFELL